MIGAPSARKAAQSTAKDDPSRLCALLRIETPPDKLIRFVANPDGCIVADVARRLPGRGVWITGTKAAVTAAVRKKVFSRSLKREIKVDADLPDTVEHLLKRRLEETFSLANKAGVVITGATKIETLIDQGLAIALVHAADAAPDGVSKLDRKFAAATGNCEYLRADLGRTGRLLTCAELSLAIGRPNVVHAALIEGGASRRLLDEAARLDRYRSESDETVAAQLSEGLNTEKA